MRRPSLYQGWHPLLLQPCYVPPHATLISRPENHPKPTGSVGKLWLFGSERQGGYGCCRSLPLQRFSFWTSRATGRAVPPLLHSHVPGGHSLPAFLLSLRAGGVVYGMCGTHDNKAEDTVCCRPDALRPQRSHAARGHLRRPAGTYLVRFTRLGRSSGGLPGFFLAVPDQRAASFNGCFRSS